MNKMKLTSKLKKKRDELGVSFNVLLQVFFFESLLKRISISSHSKSITLKGGFFLSLIVGISQRSTLDIDFRVDNTAFNKENILEIINEIILLDIDDNIIYEIVGVNDIMNQTDHKGYSISLIGKFDNIRMPFTVDIATGDPITPGKIDNLINPTILDEPFLMKTYNIETVIAEKLQTIISKKNNNSRMKDYYDMYLIWVLNHHLVNLETLRRAIIVTFKYRETEFSIKEFNRLFDSLINDSSFNTRWNSFIRKNAYTEKVDFKLVIESIIALVNVI